SDHRPHAQDVQADARWHVGPARRGGPAMTHAIVQLAYLAATVLFIFSLYWMSSPKSARPGVFPGLGGLFLGVARPWVQPGIENHWSIVLAIAAGFAVGVPLSRVSLTAVPQRTALSHAFGGLAAGLVGAAEYFLWVHEHPEQLTAFRMLALVAEIILGFLTLT